MRTPAWGACTHMTDAKFQNPSPLCHVQKSADFVPFVSFWVTPSQPHTEDVICVCPLSLPAVPTNREGGGRAEAAAAEDNGQQPHSLTDAVGEGRMEGGSTGWEGARRRKRERGGEVAFPHATHDAVRSAGRYDNDGGAAVAVAAAASPIDRMNNSVSLASSEATQRNWRH